MTLAGSYILKWVKKHTPEKTPDNNPLMGALCYIVIGKIWYPGWVNVAYKRKVSKSKVNPYAHKTIIAECWFRDIYGFYRYVTVDTQDPSFQLLKDPHKGGKARFLIMFPKTAVKRDKRK